jgi:hypothetical protein
MTVAIAAGGVAECEARGPQLAQAVSEWEEELAHLRRQYYADGSIFAGRVPTRGLCAPSKEELSSGCERPFI